MGSKSDFLENELLDHALVADYVAPGTAYVGLWTAALDDTSDGDTAGEASGGSYARVAVIRGTANWGPAAGGSIDNVTAVTFPQATGDWGTITDFAILDASSSGNILYWGALSASKIVQNGDTPEFAIGAIDITED